MTVFRQEQSCTKEVIYYKKSRYYNFSTTFEAKRMAQEDTRRMKKISRIEYCAGFEPLQSGMEQDEGSRILLPTMKSLDK